MLFGANYNFLVSLSLFSSLQNEYNIYKIVVMINYTFCVNYLIHRRGSVNGNFFVAYLEFYKTWLKLVTQEALIVLCGALFDIRFILTTKASLSDSLTAANTSCNLQSLVLSEEFVCVVWSLWIRSKPAVFSSEGTWCRILAYRLMSWIPHFDKEIQILCKILMRGNTCKTLRTVPGIL